MAVSEIHEFDDDLRTVTIRDVMGVELRQRPYTAEENAAADAKNAVLNIEQTLNADAKAAISTLQTSIGNLQTLTDKANLDLSLTDIKDLARETRRVARQVLRLTRIMMKAFDASV